MTDRLTGCAVAAIIAFSAMPAAADWDIRRDVDPMTDDVTISHALKGERSMTYHLVCRQKDGRVQQYSAGFSVPGAAFTNPEIAARVRYDGGTPEPLVVVSSSRPDFVFVGQNASESAAFASRMMKAKSVAVEFTGAGGTRNVDRFLPETSNQDAITMLEHLRECLAKMVVRE